MTDAGLVLGVDIGTSSSKGVLVGLDGRLVATAVREHDVDRPRPGYVEMDGTIWWEEFAEICRELLAGSPGEVVSVGVSGMGPCVLLADAYDRPLRAAILYGVDSRAEREIESLEALLTEAAIRGRCGSALSSQAVGPKLRWVAENEPDVFAAARRLYMPSSWLVRRLTGTYVLDHHSASQSTPLYDLQANDWYRPWCEEIAPGLELPVLAWAGDVAGTVTAEAAIETGLSAGTPVIAGTIDAWAEAASVGADTVDDLMLMYGTTMFLVLTTVEPIRSAPLWTTVGLRPGTASLAGGMASSGSITAWLNELFGDVGYPELMAAAEQSGAGARGLVMLPYFDGERTPFADPRARGVLVGLTLSHGRGDLYRAALEATAFGVRHNVESMEAAGGVVKRIVAVGGGTRGGLWPQIVSDVTGCAQEIPTYTIGASYGGAFLAARAIGDAEVTAWNPVVETIEPQPANAAVYDETYTHYRELYRATRDVVHAVAARELAPALLPTVGATKGP